MVFLGMLRTVLYLIKLDVKDTTVISFVFQN